MRNVPFGFKGAIFDVDGVIIDTARIHHRSWEITLKKYGMKFTFRDFKEKIDGMPREKGARKLFPGSPDREIKKIFHEKQANFMKLLKKGGEIRIYKSTVRLLKKLKKAGIKLAMASSSRNARTNLELTGIFPLFDVDAEGAYVKRGKPHPDLFLKAAKKIRVKPSECVVFEDAQTGITAARRAGMKSVAVRRKGVGQIHGADMTVTDLSKISLKSLESLFKR